MVGWLVHPVGRLSRDTASDFSVSSQVSPGIYDYQHSSRVTFIHSRAEEREEEEELFRQRSDPLHQTPSRSLRTWPLGEFSCTQTFYDSNSLPSHSQMIDQKGGLSQYDKWRISLQLPYGANLLVVCTRVQRLRFQRRGGGEQFINTRWIFASILSFLLGIPKSKARGTL